ncbi:MAG: tyrosine--tRNA ligase, partial [Lentisphaerae bacterium]|nr:tyrosine--tRNA ligase [Lentisphaerota bacterium]
EGMGILQLFVKAGLCTSNSEARRLLKGGGCYLDDERLTDDKLMVTPELFAAGAFSLRAGKKARMRVVLTE